MTASIKAITQTNYINLIRKVEELEEVTFFYGNEKFVTRV